MRMLKRMRRQFAVYWALGPIGDDGQRTFSEPVQLRVRWDDVQEEYQDKDGKTQTSKARVYVGPPGEFSSQEEVALLGVLWKGKIEDLTDPVEPFKNDDAYEIKSFSLIPTLNGKEFLRIATL